MCNSGKHCSKATEIFISFSDIEIHFTCCSHKQTNTIPCYENSDEKLKALKDGATLHAIA